MSRFCIILTAVALAAPAYAQDAPDRVRPVRKPPSQAERIAAHEARMGKVVARHNASIAKSLAVEKEIKAKMKEVNEAYTESTLAVNFGASMDLALRNVLENTNKRTKANPAGFILPGIPHIRLIELNADGLIDSIKEDIPAVVANAKVLGRVADVKKAIRSGRHNGQDLPTAQDSKLVGNLQGIEGTLAALLGNRGKLRKLMVENAKVLGENKDSAFDRPLEMLENNEVDFMKLDPIASITDFEKPGQKTRNMVDDYQASLQEISDEYNDVYKAIHERLPEEHHDGEGGEAGSAADPA